MITSMFYGAKKESFQFAAQLRKNLTPAEQILWNELKNNSLNLRFKCQHPISRYVVDFYCHPLLFIIEVDGSIHLIQEIHENDIDREENLKLFGLDILRFTNDMVIYDLENVRQKILDTMLIRSKLIPKLHDLDFREPG